MANAQLIIEPVINLVEGAGPAANNFGISGIIPRPGDKFAYVSGDPRDPVLDSVHVWNDTAYNFTSFWLEIIGTGTDTEDPSTIVRGAPIDARFGDVDGDGLILSDIFSTVNISADGKTIELTGGLVPRGARFTDIHLAVSDNPPHLAGIDSWYDGVQPVVPCDIASGVLGGFPRALCMFDTPVGSIGGPADIQVSTNQVVVPDNPGGRDDVDVFVLLANQVESPPGMEYTTTFSWETPVDPASLTFREWVGNFNFTPPKAIPLTHVNASDPSDEINPAEFQWVLNGDGLAVGATVMARNVAGIPPEAGFPFPAIDRYHFQIAGLEAGTTVTFTKSVAGGQVVPEPSSGALAGIALLGLLAYRHRG